VKHLARILPLLAAAIFCLLFSKNTPDLHLHLKLKTPSSEDMQIHQQIISLRNVITFTVATMPERTPLAARK
jgi:hypothetical protein